MKESYRDITNKLGRPRWWDEVGCPRYCKFSPKRANNIYATQAVLLDIQCQGCGDHYQVALSWHPIQGGPDLGERVTNATIHYGDPPNYVDQDGVGCCYAGATMNSIPVRVLEFWRHDNPIREWQRIKQLEIYVTPEWAIDEKERE